MNTALIFAGGTGSRMNTQSRPKQFLELSGKPIIIYTLEYFDSHPNVHDIVVVCIEKWIPYLKELLHKFRIMKVSQVISGGQTGQESIYKGLTAIYKNSKNPQEQIVLIHDGVRPLISQKLITDNIACVKKNGNAITVTPVIETIVLINRDGIIEEAVERPKCFQAKAPQSFILEDIMTAHRKAICDNKKDIIDSATLMAIYGHKLYTVLGSSENIKITTPPDFYLFRAIQEARENSQIWGI